MSRAAGPDRRVGIDVGGTKAQGVALDLSGNVVATAQRPTPRGDGSLGALVDTLVELADELGECGSFGVGVPGLVTRGGVLRAAPNLDGVADFDVAHQLGDRRGSAVFVDNDATCATVAEWQLGSARGTDNMILVTLGTGIGGGLVANGAVQRGMNGFAGEFGHMVVDPDGPRCPCGRRGCWETLRIGVGSGDAGTRGGNRPPVESRRAARGRRRAGGSRRARPAAARDGDPEALAVIDEFARWVALGLSNLTNASIRRCSCSAVDSPLVPTSTSNRSSSGTASCSTSRICDRCRGWRSRTFGPLAGAVGAALLPTIR